MDSNALQNLRLGPVVRAAIVKEPTAHAWRNRNGLLLGRQDTEGGNRRYDLVDAARLLLMRFLTERLGMSAQHAADTTNFARPRLQLIASITYARIDSPQTPHSEERFVLLLDSVDGSRRPEIVTERHLELIGQRRIIEVRVQLNELVDYAKVQLWEAVGGDWLELNRRLRV